MPAFRPAVIKQIQAELDNTIFSKHLFEVELDGEGFLIQLMLIPNPDCYFVLKKMDPPQSNYKFLTREAPGDVEISAQEYQLENLTQARSRISQWIHRVQEDYKISSPEYMDLDGLRDEILSRFEGAEAGSDSYFTNDEKVRLEDKLSKLEERIESLYRDKSASQHQINLMKQQVGRLKQSVEVLDKRTWLSAAVNRVFDIYKEVKAAKNEVSSIMYEFDNLLPSPDDVISSDDGGA